MREYAAEKPTVYVETTVVSYFTSRPSDDAVVYSRQQATQQLWDEYFDNFEFMVSVIVITKVWTIRVACKLSFQGTLYFSASFAYAWNFEKNPALQRCPIASQ